MKRILTQVVILSTIVIWIVYDVFAFITWGNPSTLSVCLARWGHYFPGSQLLFGILIGHLYFNQQPGDIDQRP